MAEAFEHSWDGGQSPEKLVEQLEAFEEQLDKELKDAMDTVATKIAADAAEKAPYETGHLSTHVRGELVGIVNDVVKAAVGTNVDYGLYQEYGNDRFDVAFDANAYVRPAIEENRDWATEQFEQAVNRAAKKTLG